MQRPGADASGVRRLEDSPVFHPIPELESRALGERTVP